MNSLYYRPLTTELNSEIMNVEVDTTAFGRISPDRPNYLVPDPLSVERERNGIQSNDSPQRKNSQLGNRSDKPLSIEEKSGNHASGGNPKPFDLTDTDARLLARRQLGSDSNLLPEMDYNGGPSSPLNLNNWHWLRLDALGPGWEQALRDVPVNRREALNLLIIMKKKLLRAANELTFYKERVTLLQEQLIHVKKNEEKFIRLRAAYKAQNDELERLKDKVGKLPELERTVQQQEDLISRLEGFLEKQRNRQINNSLNNRAPLVDPMTTNFFDALPPSPSPLPETSDTIAATALRNLASENNNLRQTVAELNRTVRNLAQQQQDDHNRLKNQEEKYREELEALREHQNRLAQQQAVQNRHLDQVDQDRQRHEKMELFRMLDAADERIKNLEDELEMRDRRVNPGPQPGTSLYNRKPGGYREPSWKYPGQDKPSNRLPPVNGIRDRPTGGRRMLQDYLKSNASDSGLNRRHLQPGFSGMQRGSSVGDEDWFAAETGFEDF